LCLIRKGTTAVVAAVVTGGPSFVVATRQPARAVSKRFIQIE
jgi:hypothetical protein